MKTSQFFYSEKNENVEIWHETVNSITHYWKKVNGISWAITKRQYENLIKKYNLENTLA